MAFLASDCALKYSLISVKSHFFKSVIFDFSSEVISCFLKKKKKKDKAKSVMHKMTDNNNSGH